MGTRARWARILAIGALVGLAAPGATAAVREAELPELEQRQAGVLDLATGKVARAPASRDFASEAEFKDALRKLGDLAYDDAEGGVLFVSSGRVGRVPAGSAQELAARDVAGALRADDTVRGEAIAPASLLAVATRSGAVVLVRILRRTPQALAVAWLEPVAAGGYPVDGVAALLALETGPLTPPVQRAGELTLPAVAETTRRGWSFAKGQMVDIPAKGTPEGDATAMREFAEALATVGDIAFTTQPLGRLWGAGRTMSLGQVRAVPLQGSDLASRLRRGVPLSWTPAEPGRLLFLETRDRGYALLRITRVDADGLHASWVYQPGGTAVFTDLASLDTFEARAMEAGDNLGLRLLAAVRQGDRRLVDDLLAAGADPNTRDRTSTHPVLLEAAIQGSEPIVAALLKGGAAVDLTSRDGWTALHAAAKLGRLAVVKLLVHRGANVELRTPAGETALDLALAARPQNERLIHLLRRRTDEPISLLSAARGGDRKTVRRLLDDGADPNQRDDKGETVLGAAARAGQPDLVRLLLRAGADPRIRMGREGTTLDIAARAGRRDVVVVLLEDAQSLTPADRSAALYNATLAMHPEVVGAMLDRGTDPSLDVGQPYSPLQLALRFGTPEVVEVYRERGVELPLWAAARVGDVARIDRLLPGVDADAPASPDGSTALGLAIQAGQLEAADRLLAKGASPNTQDARHERMTALHYAAQTGSAPAAAVLLGRGADPNVVNAIGRTPLYEAVSSGQYEVSEALLRGGADPNIAPGIDPILDAAGTKELRDLLLRYGARRPQ